MRAALYARVSTEEQATGGFSLDQQLEAMRRYAAAEGWTVAGEYVDPGFSGSDGGRPAFRQMMADAEARRLDVVMVHKLDRFYRNLRGQLDALERLAGWGVAFASVVEGLDWSTPWGKLVQNQLGAFNQFYLDNLRQETRKGKRGRAKAGKTNASTAPYGYVRDDQGAIVVDAATAPAVVLAFESYASGQHADMDVARVLSEAGYAPSVSAESGRWTREAVRYMLTNPFYAGAVRYGIEVYAGHHEAIVSPELFDQVQAVRVRRRNGRGGRRREDRVYLLAGLVRCHHCGSGLVAQTSEGRSRRGVAIAYYYCPARRRAIDCRAEGRFAQAAAIEKQVADLVMRLRLPDDWRERLEELAGTQEDRNDKEGRRRYLQDKLRRLQELYVEGDVEKPEYNRRKGELQAQLEVLREPAQTEIEQAGEALESLGAVWANAPRTYQRDMLQVIFESIRVDTLAGELICVKPYAPFVPLFRMDGLEEREDGCFYSEEREEAGSEG